MGQRGLSMGLGNVRQALGQLIALRERASNEETRRQEVEAQMGATESRFGRQLSQDDKQFGVSSGLQRDQVGIAQQGANLAREGFEEGNRRWNLGDNRLTAFANSQPNYTAAIMAGQGMHLTPEAEFANQQKLLTNNQVFTAGENLLDRRSQQGIATTQANRGNSPGELMFGGMSNMFGRMASAETDPETMMTNLKNYTTTFGPMLGFSPDGEKTQAFIDTALPGFVQNRFGGDMGAAVEGLSSDPALYMQMFQSGFDPDAILGALTSQQAEQAEAVRQQRLSEAQALMNSGTQSPAQQHWTQQR